MKRSEVNRFNELYQRHLSLLKFQGKSQKTIDAYSRAEIEKIIGKTHKLRYRVFLLTTYSLGLRLEEALSLQVGDMDAERKKVHVRRGKDHKDRLIPLPDLTLQGLRELWRRHRHPYLLFPKTTGSLETIQKAITHMDRGGAQNAMKRVVIECGIKKSLHPYPPPQL